MDGAIHAPFRPAESIAPLVDILQHLDRHGYRFVSPTPATHRRVAQRRARAEGGDLRDIFGWGRDFDAADIDPALLGALQAAGVVDGAADAAMRLTIRVSSVGDRLFVHSASGAQRDAVFLGPDSYRFARLLQTSGAGLTDTARVLDVGTGAGVGALTIAAMYPQAAVWGSDVNAQALRYFTANARFAGLSARPAHGSGLSAVEGSFDLITANPPYIAGSGGRTYRDGGAALGTEVALAWTAEGVRRLRPNGRFILYTGSPIVDGTDLVRRKLSEIAERAGAAFSYEELDPDVFGGTLERPDYDRVERIAAVAAVLRLDHHG